MPSASLLAARRDVGRERRVEIGTAHDAIGRIARHAAFALEVFTQAAAHQWGGRA